MEPFVLPASGEIVAGKYELVRPLGKGAMGLVYEARHVGLRQKVAIKFLRPMLVAEEGYVARFNREARAAARLSSPHVARVLDVDRTPSGLPYMVIELLEGHDLAVELDVRGAIPVREAVDLILQVCSAMAEAHANGVIHRDLKPSNLFLAETPAGRVLKVLDFGVSKVVSEDEDGQMTAAPTQLGTPQYMSPEQVLASPEIDGRADVWALAVILYKMVSGSFPIRARGAAALQIAIATERPRPLAEALPGVDPAFAAIVMRGLEREVDARHSGVDEMAAALAPYGSGEVDFIGAPPSRADRFGSSIRAVVRGSTAPAVVRDAPPPPTTPMPPGGTVVETADPRIDVVEAPNGLGAGTTLENANANANANAPTTRRRTLWSIAAAPTLVLAWIVVGTLGARPEAPATAATGRATAPDEAIGDPTRSVAAAPVASAAPIREPKERAPAQETQPTAAVAASTEGAAGAPRSSRSPSARDRGYAPKAPATVGAHVARATAHDPLHL